MGPGPLVDYKVLRKINPEAARRAVLEYLKTHGGHIADAVKESHDLYRSQVKQAAEKDGEAKLAEKKRRRFQPQEQEAQLARWLVTGKLGEDTYDRLRIEWQE